MAALHGLLGARSCWLLLRCYPGSRSRRVPMHKACVNTVDPLDSNQEPTPYEGISRLRRQSTEHSATRLLRRNPGPDVPFTRFSLASPVSPICGKLPLCATLCSPMAPPQGGRYKRTSSLSSSRAGPLDSLDPHEAGVALVFS